MSVDPRDQRGRPGQAAAEERLVERRENQEKKERRAVLVLDTKALRVSLVLPGPQAPLVPQVLRFSSPRTVMEV